MQPSWCQSDEQQLDHLSPWFRPLRPQILPLIFPGGGGEVGVHPAYQREPINVGLLEGKVALFSAQSPLFLLFE